MMVIVSMRSKRSTRRICHAETWREVMRRTN